MSKLINFPTQDTLTDKERAIIIAKNKEKYGTAVEQVIESFTIFSSWYMDMTRRLEHIDNRLPNIGITLSNKITEINKYFTAHGVSMYVRSPSNSPYMKKAQDSLIGDSILEDLLTIGNDGLKEIIHIQDEFNAQFDKKDKENKKLINKIKKTLKKQKTNLIVFNDEEQHSLNQFANVYRQLDEEIWKYDLKERLPKAVAHQINYNGTIDYFSLSIILEERVRKDLVALDLEDLYPKVLEEVFTQKDPKTGNYIQAPQ